MKLAHIGPLIFILTFIIGFWSAPVRFVPIRWGPGALTGGHNVCRFSDYTADRLGILSRWSCTFDNESQALNYFESLMSSNNVIVQTDSYVLVQIRDMGGDYYCSTRRDGRFITNVTSRSLKHIAEYERRFLSATDR